MVKKVECEMIICDNCKAQFEDASGFSVFADSHHTDPADYDWHVDDDKHYCPDCHSIDDDDNVFIITQRFKP